MEHARTQHWLRKYTNETVLNETPPHTGAAAWTTRRMRSKNVHTKWHPNSNTTFEFWYIFCFGRFLWFRFRHGTKRELEMKRRKKKTNSKHDTPLIFKSKHIQEFHHSEYDCNWGNCMATTPSPSPNAYRINAQAGCVRSRSAAVSYRSIENSIRIFRNLNICLWKSASLCSFALFSFWLCI